MESAITSEVGILAVLTGVASFFFYLEKRTAWRFFNYFPPLLFIYAVPVVLANCSVAPVITREVVASAGRPTAAIGPSAEDEFTADSAAAAETPATEYQISFKPVIPTQSPAYDWMKSTVLPFFLLLMLLKVDVLTAVRVMGRGVIVMLMGTAGVVLGAPIAYLLVKSHLGPEAWKQFGMLAGSWIGGAGNMAAVQSALKAPDSFVGLPVLADALVYLVWIPVLLGSKSCAAWFNRFARVDPGRVEMLEHSYDEVAVDEVKMMPRHVLYLLFVGLGGTWLAGTLSRYMPEFGAVLTASAWNIIFISVLGVILSMTPAKTIPKTHEVAVAMVFLYMAVMGAKADLEGLVGEAPWFVMAALVWILVHGAFCVLGARVLHVDIHSTAIASAANIGGVATASIVATHHNDKLVPVGILMALIGYAIGNIAPLGAAELCRLVSLL